VGRLTDALRPITAIGVEWWTVQAGPSIDNIVIGRSKKALDLFANSSSMAKVRKEDQLYIERVTGQSNDKSSKALPTWTFVAVGAWGVGVVVLMIVFKCCCIAPQTKPKNE
jgi:hypothetical protein